MPIIQIALLLVVMGGLTLLLVQNWSPVLPLVFLGVKTQAIPLAVWILFSIAAGASTSLFITGLYKLSNYFASSKRSKRRNVIGRSSAESRHADKTPASAKKPDTDSTTRVWGKNQSPPSSTPSDTFDDWDSDSTSDDDWDFEEGTDKTPNSSQNTVRDSTNYEVKTEPKSGSQSGSVYSYSYREPSNSSVGKTESVYDADYRVIAPPYRETNKPAEDEDWGFEDDDDFEDEGNDSPKSGNH